MRFAAIADIHGNVLALEAVLADLAALGLREVVNLGDHLSGPLEAARTADLLMERGFPSVRGDQDRIQVELVRAGDLRRSDIRQLAPHHIDWLAGLPATLIYRNEVLLCHAAPDDDAAFWLDEVTSDGAVRPRALDEIEQCAKGIDASLILCGHTHIPRVVRLRDGRMVVNPGSVGLPGYVGRGPIPYRVEVGTPHACYAILERGRTGWSTTFRYVAYDASAMAELARKSGMIDWANAIATGWVG
jgi:predicted phosphodiesterase